MARLAQLWPAWRKPRPIAGPVTAADLEALQARNAQRLQRERRRMIRARDAVVQWPEPAIHWRLRHPNQ